MTDFEIANIMGIISYDQELDLSVLAETFKQRNEISSVTYEPAENHWLQTRFDPGNTYIPFYRSGKCSIVGAKSPEHFEELVDRVNKLMCEIVDFDLEPSSEIKNIVATAELDSIPPLESVAIELGLEQTEYEPEQFPALIYRVSKSVILIFSGGDLVWTGHTDIEELSTVVNDVTEQIENIVV